MLTSKINGQHDDVEGFGYIWDDDSFYPTSTGFNGMPATSKGIVGGASKTLRFKPILGQEQKRMCTFDVGDS